LAGAAGYLQGERRIGSPNPLRGHKLVLIDTSIWIYHFELHPQFGSARAVCRANGVWRLSAELPRTCTVELLCSAQNGAQDVATKYELLLNHFPNFELAAVTARFSLMPRLAGAMWLTDTGCDSTGDRLCDLERPPLNE